MASRALERRGVDEVLVLRVGSDDMGKCGE
jgi:hypothetical protein